jgi:uncharacterized protein (TIGR02722 family)
MDARLVRHRALVPAVVAASALVLAACSSAPVVSREEVDSDIDLSGYWNDSDSRRVAEEMIDDAAGRPWAQAFASSRGRKPTVIVGGVRNLSHEHVNTRTFVKDLEREWVRTGRVRLVASRDERDGVREEREDQSRHASLETAKSMGRELGADFMLLGQIDSILDSAEGESVRYYQVELELIDIETNEKTWIGQKKLKKRISRKRLRW